jgi:two-component system, OmpR family, sensor histidine kinase CpxA
MSVFKKIFLSFWAALILEVIISVVFYPPPHSRPSPFVTNATTTVLRTYGGLALQEFETGGSAGEKAYADDLATQSGVQLYLFDSAGNEIGGRETPPNVKQFERSHQESSFDQDAHLILTSVKVRTHPDTITAIGAFQERGGPRRPPLQSLLRHVFVFVLTSGVICFFLARYLTSPIVELRSVAHRLSNGELAARVETKSKRKDEIAELVYDFNAMAERIQSLVAAQHRLIADISHELRTPLARLSIAAGILRQKTGENAAGMIDRMERETERLNALIGQLLMLSNLESGGSKPTFALIEFNRLVEEVVADAQIEATERKCSIVVVSTRVCYVEGNPELLRRAVENVVRNAVRYTREGTSVEVTLETVNEFRRDLALLKIRDHGNGIPDTEFRKIFMPFYTIADARDRQAGGIGLGLAIADRALRMHEGSTRAYNSEEGGLVIELRVPLAPEES